MHNWLESLYAHVFWRFCVKNNYFNVKWDLNLVQTNIQ
jgi:hypothetical protein